MYQRPAPPNLVAQLKSSSASAFPVRKQWKVLDASYIHQNLQIPCFVTVCLPRDSVESRRQQGFIAGIVELGLELSTSTHEISLETAKRIVQFYHRRKERGLMREKIYDDSSSWTRQHIVDNWRGGPHCSMSRTYAERVNPSILVNFPLLVIFLDCGAAPLRHFFSVEGATSNATAAFVIEGKGL